MLSISGKKEQHLAMFFCFSIPVLNQRAWFSGKPVPQFKKKKKKEKSEEKRKIELLFMLFFFWSSVWKVGLLLEILFV